MAISRVYSLCMVLCVIFVSTSDAQTRVLLRPTGERKSMQQGETERDYRIHVPSSYDGGSKFPLVLMLHGGGGDADIASRMGMTPLADKHDFLVVYPEAIDRHWNDGRESERFKEHDAEVDDVAFIKELVEQLKTEYEIDDGKVFTAGLSNGGFMSHRLAIELSESFAAAAVMIATLGVPLDEKFEPKNAVSMLFMNGTQDTVVPYDGGDVKLELAPRLLRKTPSRGSCISTDAAIKLWLKKNKLDEKEPDVQQLPDVDEKDGCTIERTLWSDADAPAAVVLYRIEGGGHSVPGGVQYLPKQIIGNVCRDIDGLEVMWQFFAEHPRKPPK